MWRKMKTKMNEKFLEFLDDSVASVLDEMEVEEESYEWETREVDSYTYEIKLMFEDSFARFVIIRERMLSVGIDTFRGFDEDFVRRFQSLLFDQID
jgi:hypothetical protein